MLMMYHRMFLRTFFFNQKESMTEELKDRSKNGPWCEMTEQEETQGTRWIVGWGGGRGGAWAICCQSSIIPGFPTQTLPISNPGALFTWPLLLRPPGCSKAPLPSRTPLLTNCSSTLVFPNTLKFPETLQLFLRRFSVTCTLEVFAFMAKSSG